MKQTIVELYNEGLDDLIQLVNEARFRINTGDFHEFREAILSAARIAGSLLYEPAEDSLVLAERRTPVSLGF
jgi:hypothetical protein